jgi:hypothetical protein
MCLKLTTNDLEQKIMDRVVQLKKRKAMLHLINIITSSLISDEKVLICDKEIEALKVLSDGTIFEDIEGPL